MDLETFVSAYIECALWSSTDNSRDDGGDPLDDNYGEEDLTAFARGEIEGDCKNFVEYVEEACSAEAYAHIVENPGQAGHDFWLTRNGHGAGFWDRGLGKIGDELSKASETFGSCDLTVEAGRIHVG